MGLLLFSLTLYEEGGGKSLLARAHIFFFYDAERQTHPFTFSLFIMGGGEGKKGGEKKEPFQSTCKVQKQREGRNLQIYADNFQFQICIHIGMREKEGRRTIIFEV